MKVQRKSRPSRKCPIEQQRRKTWLFVDETEFVVCCYDRQPVKTNLFNKIMEMLGIASITLNEQNFFVPGSIFLNEVSYERAENELFRKFIWYLLFEN